MTTSDKADSDAGSSKLRKTAGQVRGPVQITFARSVDPIIQAEHAITRMAVTNERDLEKERTMGRKFTVPYGLYVAHGFISAHLADQTGFSQADLDVLVEALSGAMWEHDRSAARGQMTTRGLYLFKHESKLGNAPAHRLFERIQPALRADISVPRSFSDYQIAVRDADLPSGVELQRIEL